MIMNFDLKYAVIDVKKKKKNHTAIKQFLWWTPNAECSLLSWICFFLSQFCQKGKIEQLIISCIGIGDSVEYCSINWHSGVTQYGKNHKF